MAVIVFDVAAFRASFPAFAQSAKYPDASLQDNFDTASAFISTNDYGVLNGPARGKSLNLLTAHLTALGDQIALGDGGGFVTESRVGDVSVSIQPPPEKSAFMYWLSQTPYGQALAALLSMLAPGGLFIPAGCFPERSGFRKAGGRF